MKLRNKEDLSSTKTFVDKKITQQIEELFSNPDTEIEPIIIKNDKQAIREMREIQSIFKSSTEWDQKLMAIQRGMAVVKGGACNFISFIQLVPTLQPLIIESVSNLRSTLVKNSCLFAAQLSQKLQSSFDSTAEAILPTLFKPTTHGTQIIADSCMHSILSISKYVHSQRVLKAILTHSTSKSSIHRTIVSNCICNIVKEWNPQVFSQSMESLEAIINKLVADATPEARSYAKNAKLHFHNLQTSIKSFTSAPIQSYTPKRSASVSSSRKSVSKPPETPQIKPVFRNAAQNSSYLDDIRQMIVQGDESSLKAHSEVVSKTIINGILMKSKDDFLLSLTLFTEVLAIMPDFFYGIIAQIIEICLILYCNSSMKEKKASETALKTIIETYGFSQFIEICTGFDSKNSIVFIKDFVTSNKLIIDITLKSVLVEFLNRYSSIPESYEILSIVSPDRGDLRVQEKKEISITSPQNKNESDSEMFNEKVDKDFSKSDNNKVPTSDQSEIKNVVVIDSPKIFEIPLKNSDKTTFDTSRKSIRKQSQEPIVEELPKMNDENTKIWSPKADSIERNSSQLRWISSPFGSDFDQDTESSHEIRSLIRRVETSTDKTSSLTKVHKYLIQNKCQGFIHFIPILIRYSKGENLTKADECIQLIFTEIPNQRLYDTVLNSIAREKSRDFIEFLIKIVKFSDRSDLNKQIAAIMSVLIVLCNNQLPEIRKSVVFCLVEIYTIIGSDFLVSLNQVPQVTKKLVLHYAEEHKKNNC